MVPFSNRKLQENISIFGSMKHMWQARYGYKLLLPFEGEELQSITRIRIILKEVHLNHVHQEALACHILAWRSFLHVQVTWRIPMTDFANKHHSNACDL